MKIRRLNEKVLIVEFSAEISQENSMKVHSLKVAIDHVELTGIVETWISYHTVAVAYDPGRTSFEKLASHIEALSFETTLNVLSKTQEIPIRYHTNTEDIKALARHTGLSVDEIALIHQKPIYLVAMLGFQPGFPFLVGLPKSLHQPRKRVPNPRVKAGSVAIGGSQTGIYPGESPGGWYIIGETELPLFSKPDQFLLKAGDQVKFTPIG